MGFQAAIKTCFRKYVTFSGRASRAEYWYFVLFLFLGGIAAGALDAIVFGVDVVQASPGEFSAESDGPIASLFALATILPMIAAGWRRMHDSGRSGLHLFYPLIVIVGIVSFVSLTGLGNPFALGDMPETSGLMTAILGIALIVFAISPLIVVWWLTRPSDPGANRYGPTPR